jgi:hypothetical protein
MATDSPARLSLDRQDLARQQFETRLNRAQVFMDSIVSSSLAGLGADAFVAALDDGVLLCDLVNEIKNICIPRRSAPATPQGKLRQTMQNITTFINVCKKFGIDERCVLCPNDLLNKNCSRVVDNIIALQVAMHAQQTQTETIVSSPGVQLASMGSPAAHQRNQIEGILFAR